MKSVRCSLVLLAACTTRQPTPTGAVCPEPDPMTLTWETFGRDFGARYCNHCHDSRLPRGMRHGAPLYHDTDTLLHVLQAANHVDEQAGWGPKARNDFMPPDRCPSTPGGPIDHDCARPTEDERTDLAVWLACESNRPHDFTDGGVER